MDANENSGDMMGFVGPPYQLPRKITFWFHVEVMGGKIK
jgi:hypothetical protein